MQVPGFLGLSANEEISSFLKRHLTAPGITRNAVAGYAQRTEAGFRVDGGGADTTLEQVFDLASISKTLLALCTSSLVVEGQLNWTTQLQAMLPQLTGTFAGDKTVEQLLSHRSGLAAHREFFLRSWSGSPSYLPQWLVTIANCQGTQPADTPLYSDLGYMLVGAALEELTQLPLDVLIVRRISQRYGLRVGSARSFWAQNAGTWEAVAPTEISAGRGGPLRGMVHDDNAWMLSGWRCSGHAGLFGDLESILRLGGLLLDEAEFPLVAPLLQPRPSGSLLLGLDRKSGTNSSAGQLASARTFGHLGFTGTSFWCDPERQRVTVLLTNRVCPTRDNPRLAAFRSKIHDFLWGC